MFPTLKVLLIHCVVVTAFIGGAPCGMAEPAASDQVHTPEKGSAERKGILDALHKVYTTGSGSEVKFLVKHFKVHNGWAWINVVPLDKNQKPEGEDWPSLLHLVNGQWVIIDLIAINTDPEDQVGPMDPSAKYLRLVQKKCPGVPSDIFPKPSR